MTPLERFMAKVDKTDTCWLWTAYKLNNGYGRFGAGGRGGTVLAHRWSYEHFVGPIPEGLQIDHLCRVRHCVNPEHMEPVTQRENTLRGVSLSAQNARKTHCPQGHPYDYVTPTGARHCRRCKREVLRRFRRKAA